MKLAKVYQQLLYCTRSVLCVLLNISVLKNEDMTLVFEIFADMKLLVAPKVFFAADFKNASSFALSGLVFSANPDFGF